MKNKYFVITLGFSLLISLMPFVLVYFINDFSYPKLPVEFMDDSLYYYSRAVQVAEGNIFIGNSYIYEKVGEVTPAFFVADWIWAIPLVFGFSLMKSILINQVVWFIILGALLFKLFKKIGVSDKYSFFFTIATLISSYWYIARPISMQVIFPLFILFILSLINFFEKPKDVKSIILLGFSATLSVYVYTYLTQIIFVIFGVICLLSLFLRFRDYIYIWFSGGFTLVLSIPFLIYTWTQLRHPLYFETLYRIGLVETYSIGTSAIFYLSLILLSLGSVFFIKKYISASVFYSFILLSVGLFMATISNVFTGKDLETAVHIGRFVEIWSIIIFLFFLYTISINKKINKIFILIIILSFFGITNFLKFQFKVWSSINKTIVNNEVYYEPIKWLSENTPKNSIILANDSISSYIPVFRNNYVVFHPNAQLYIMEDDEAENRYLVSRVFQSINLDDIKDDMRKYAGAGHTAHRHAVINRNIKICKLLKLDKVGLGCGSFVNQYDLKGDEYFENLLSVYTEFSKKPIDLIKKYNVSHVLVDTERDYWNIPNDLKRVWSYGGFDIYEI